MEEEIGDTIQFYLSESKNKSQFVYSFSASVNDDFNTICSLKWVKAAAEDIIKTLLKVDFGLDKSFCDVKQLRECWTKIHIPEILVTASYFWNKFLNRGATHHLWRER